VLSSALFTLPALRRARDLIDRDYATALDLNALAREAGYSRYHFARALCLMVGFESQGSFSTLFKRLVGQSPSEYQTNAARAGGTPPIPGCVVLMWTRPHPQTQQAARSATPPQPPRMTGIQQPGDVS